MGLKIGVICDPHIGAASLRGTARRLWWNRLNRNFEKVLDCVLSLSDVVIVAGDVFHQNQPTVSDLDALQQVLRNIENKHGHIKDRLYIFYGNHDKPPLHLPTVVCPLELFKSYATIVTDVYKLDKVTLVPWKLLPKVEEETEILITHEAFPKCHAFGKPSVDKKLFKSVVRKIKPKLIISGHVHIPGITELGDVYVVYPGSVSAVRVDELTFDHYCLILDEETYETLILTTDKPKAYTKFITLDNKATTIPNSLENLIDTHIYIVNLDAECPIADKIIQLSKEHPNIVVRYKLMTRSREENKKTLVDIISHLLENIEPKTETISATQLVSAISEACQTGQSNYLAGYCDQRIWNVIQNFERLCGKVEVVMKVVHPESKTEQLPSTS